MNEDTDIVISLRDIQHFLYCPHRWGLINIDCSWAENAFVTKANLTHKRVHDKDGSYISRQKEVMTSVQVYCDDPDMNIYGVTDCIELRENNSGIKIPGHGDKNFSLCIVEYKPTLPKDGNYNDDDLMQVFAQKICVDSIFGTCSEGILYYADKKKRVPLPLNENYELYRSRLVEILAEIRKNMAEGIIPLINKGQKCSGCSMKDMCFPKLKSGKKWFYTMLHKEDEEAT